MGADWARWCARKGLKTIEPGVLEVSLGERRHVVRIEEAGDDLRVSATVARPSAVREVDDLPLRLALRNRRIPVIGFRLDQRGGVLGEAWIARAGLEPDELAFVVRRAAVECDRFEFELTGKDVE